MRTDQEIRTRLNGSPEPSTVKVLQWVLDENPKMIPIDKIKIYKNINFSCRRLAELRADLFHLPTITVNQNYELLDGLHTLLAISLSGSKEILAIVK